MHPHLTLHANPMCVEQIHALTRSVRGKSLVAVGAPASARGRSVRIAFGTGLVTPLAGPARRQLTRVTLPSHTSTLRCHAEVSSLSKFFGACNEPKALLDRCARAGSVCHSGVCETVGPRTARGSGRKLDRGLLLHGRGAHRARALRRARVGAWAGPERAPAGTGLRL